MPSMRISHQLLLSITLYSPQVEFQKMDGVKRCVVGYSGGSELNPTYRMIKDHTEALLVEFDPKVISYEDLVIEWSRMHSPRYQSSCQYRSAVWYLDDEQRETAEEVVKGMRAAARGGKVYTGVQPATRFYKAEEYHQNFLTKERSPY
jgi:peptide-methionine (S)-S-oxide reductase